MKLDIIEFNKRCVEFLKDYTQGESSLNFHLDWDLISLVMSEIQNYNSDLILIKVGSLKFIIGVNPRMDVVKITLSDENHDDEDKVEIVMAINAFLVKHQLRLKCPDPVAEYAENLIHGYSVSIVWTDRSKPSNPISLSTYLLYAFTPQDACDTALDVLRSREGSEYYSIVNHSVMNLNLLK